MGRTRNLGYLTNLLSFDASGNITTTGTISASGGTVSYLPLSGGVLTGELTGTGAIFSDSLAVGAASASNFKAYINGDVYGATGFYTRNTASTFIGSANNTSGISVNGSTGVTQIASGGNYVLTLANSGTASFTGNVGIGTTTPGAGLVIASNQPTSNTYHYLTFRNLASGFGTWGISKRNTNDLGITFSTDGDTPNTGTALLLAYGGAATFLSSVTATRLYTGNGGISVSGYGYLSQTVSGQMTILGHNIIADSSATNTVTVVNGGWYSSMIKLYYNDGITFHTSTTVYSANTVYPIGSTERMRITLAGNVGIGTADPAKRLEISDDNGSTSSTTGLKITNYSGTTGAKSGIVFQNYDNHGAAIWSTRTGSTAGELVFGVNAAGGTAESNIVERVKIQSDGQVVFQSSIQLRNGQINSLSSGGVGQPIYLNFAGNGAVYAGSSYAVLYAGSDVRIKKDITVVDSMLDKVLQLIPKQFKYKGGIDIPYYGFIAQEVEQILPELVRTDSGVTMCEDQPIANQKSIESYGLVWASILVKAIQELKAEVDLLKNKQ